MKELFAAVSKMQAELRGALKDSKNPFYKSNYADLGSIWDAARDPLTKNGLCIIQTTVHGETGLILVTTLGHISGEYTSGYYPIQPIKNDPQGVGSAISYARRYAMAAILGVHQTDDDGERAMARPNLIVASQPEPEDGNHGYLGYRIPFGKFKSKSLEEVGAVELRDYVLYLEKKAAKDGQIIDANGPVGDFISRVEEFVGSFENQP